jgi:L-ribulokinase
MAEKKALKTENPLMIGADYGTNSCRYIVATKEGKIIAEHVYNYESGQDGIILDPAKPLLARQNPNDYIKGFHVCMEKILEQVDKIGTYTRNDVVGIAFDTTGSTPIPVDNTMTPVGNAWLWKDKTSAVVAAEFNKLAKEWGSHNLPDYTKYTGGLTSPEWIISKIIQHRIDNFDEFVNTTNYVEHCDFMSAWTVKENQDPKSIARSRCAAGHKLHFHEQWKGLPSQSFISGLAEISGIHDGSLDNLVENMLFSADKVQTAEKSVGLMRKDLTDMYKLGEVAVAGGAFDCHMGVVGMGIAPGIYGKVMGTSTCDLTVGSAESELLVPGICGQVNGSIIPGMIGYEAGQSSAGDAFAWVRNLFLRAEKKIPDNQPLIATDEEKAAAYAFLTEEAMKLNPAGTNVAATGYFNGIRTPDVDPRARGIIGGLNLSSFWGSLYRAVAEGVALESYDIIKRFEENKVPIEQVVACGGLTKDDFVMDIHAAVSGKKYHTSSIKQTCALGAAMFAGVAAGVFENIPTAQESMNPPNKRFAKTYEPDMGLHNIYNEKSQTFQDIRYTALPVFKNQEVRMERL